MSSMQVTFSMKGMDEFINKLRSIGDSVSQKESAEACLLEAAGPIVDAAKARAPRDPGGRPGFGADTIHAAPAETRGDSEVARVAIGPGLTGWHLRFSEEGTSKEAARPWLRPAVDGGFGGFKESVIGWLQNQIRGAF